MTARQKDIHSTAAWSGLNGVLSKAVSGFLQEETEHTAVGDQMPSPAHAASITLGDVDHRLEIGLGIIAGPASASKLAEALFGDASLSEDPEMVQDIFNELANILMGAVKSAFAEPGFNFTGRLPKGEDLVGLHQFICGFGRQRVARVTLPGASMILLSGVRPMKPIEVDVGGLCEDMILAEDFENEKGVVLLRSGTRLTAGYVDKLLDAGTQSSVRVFRTRAA